MNRTAYRALLYLLPRDRRERYGSQMELAFAEVVSQAPGPVARIAAWTREIRGLLRFSFRERFENFLTMLDTLAPGFGRRRPRIGGQLRWAWRAFVGRGRRGVAVILLLAVALAANAVVFSTADSFLLHRVEYPQADRLVSIGRASTFGGWSSYDGPEAIAAWRGFTDLFSGVYAYGSGGSAYFTEGPMGPRRVAAAEVEPGLLELLGAKLVAGRFFAAGEGPDIIPRPNGMRGFAPTLSIVSESLAVEQFGGAQAAIGRTLALGTYDTTIVGVIRSPFHFPTGAERIWTPLNLGIVLPNQGRAFFAQLAPGMTPETANTAVQSRAAAVQARKSPPWNRIKEEPSSLRRFAQVDDDKQARIIWLLFAAAGALLLIACANVISLELAAAVTRARTSAIALALGATPGALMAAAMTEGLFIFAGAITIGLVLAWQTLGVLTGMLPATTIEALANPLDVDLRTLAFMSAVTALAWIVTSLPVAVAVSGRSVVEGLRLDSRSASGSRLGARLRRFLTGVEVALSVCLLIGALLAARSYSALLAIPKGFDVAGVVSVDIGTAPSSTVPNEQLQSDLLAGMRALPFVRYVGAVTANPPENGSAINGTLTISGVASPLGALTASGYGVDPEYFRAMGLPIVQGRSFDATDAANAVVVDEAFARRVWPNGDALGGDINFGSARLNSAGPVYHVIGVAAHLRTKHDTPSALSTQAFPLYYRLVDYVPLSFVARLTDDTRIGDLQAVVRGITPTSRVRVQTLRERYARTYSDEMLAASVMKIFGVLALIVTGAGVYSVMAFLVVGRTREIGLRFALGADRSAIVRLIVGSSVGMVTVGALAGVGAALLAARWGAPLLFGVSARDPWIYAGVALLVVVTALIATWRPALVASRVDPSQLLRE